MSKRILDLQLFAGETIFDMVNAQEIATYWTEAVENRIPYLGATLFPAKKQLGLDLLLRGDAVSS